MIYTVTFNPSLDYIVSLDGFEKGRTNRTVAERLVPGGKGINVSAVLHNLGIGSVALGFVAGFTGAQIEKELEKTGLCTDFIRVSGGFSRINVKLKDYDGTEINGMGPDIGGADVKLLYGKLDKLGNDDVLVLAGSVPGCLPAEIYRDMMEFLQGRGVRFVVDAAGELLLGAISHRPFLIKPNRQELGELFSVTLSSRESAVPYAKKLREMGAENVLVSMGGAGAVLVDETGAVHMLQAPKGTLVNAVGAGDSMVAGFLAGYLNKRDYAYAFRMAVAAGSASAFSEGLAGKEDVEHVAAGME